jgi:exodeoxyribonuclease-5
MSVTLSLPQADALKKIRNWYKSGGREFFLFGFAGTGKSTLARELPEALNMPMYTGGELSDQAEPGILYLAYTGKAASVLRRKGLFAFTIHQGIYGRALVNEPLVDKVLNQIREAEASGTADPDDIKGLLHDLRRLQKPNFSMGKGKHINNAGLVVVDECSMVDDRLYSDLMSWGKPVLFMGDPAQLPPVGGSAKLIEATPDVLLTDIHRQALENPIIRFSQHLRESSILPVVDTPECVITKQFPQVEDMARFDQIITGHHVKRRVLNRYLSQHHDFGDFPAGKKEKLINLKNDHKLGIMNGEMVTLGEVEHSPVSDRFLLAKVFTEFDRRQLGDSEFDKLPIYDGHFRDTVQFVNGRVEREFRNRKDLMELDWGYAITCHKAQGSEWDSVFVWDSQFGRSEVERRQWLYTAITRAKSNVKIYSPSAV